METWYWISNVGTLRWRWSVWKYFYLPRNLCVIKHFATYTPRPFLFVILFLNAFSIAYWQVPVAMVTSHMDIAISLLLLHGLALAICCMMWMLWWNKQQWRVWDGVWKNMWGVNRVISAHWLIIQACREAWVNVHFKSMHYIIVFGCVIRALCVLMLCSCSDDE